MDFDTDESLKEWAKDKPLSILQLDPADRAVLRIADERDAIQKKTFTKWVNKHLKKGRTNIELREQFILADGVSQSMSAFKPKTSTSSRSTSITSGSAGPITKVREKSIKSVPMGSTKGRSSFSQETPDSLSDNEGFSKPTPRRSTSSYRSSLTPSGSLPGSRNSSRPASRTGSKPPSRHGSNLSLDSTDDSTPGRLTKTSVTPRTSAPRSRLNVPNGGSTFSRPRTPTGSTTPTTPGSRTRSGSGSSTPVPPGSSRLQRKPSGASDISSASRKGSRTPTDPRAPFRL